MTDCAVVIGAGWAGEGHVLGLRSARVDVVALCGRTPGPATERARRLAIPNVRFDWHAALTEFHPDIVSIATPAAPHHEIVAAAAHLGCHVVCEKPLAPTATEAAAMLLAVERAGVKHAYAATACYAPAIVHTHRLLAAGLVGPLYEIESVLHMNFPTGRLPFGWIHQRDQGGGLLNNVFTHKLAQVQRATGGHVRSAAGETRSSVLRAPVGPAIHDFRNMFSLNDVWSPDGATEWRQADADTAYTLILRLQMPDGSDVNVLFRGSTLSTTPEPEYLVFHGESGSLYMHGAHGGDDHIRHFTVQHQHWKDIPIPPDGMAAIPLPPDYIQRCWNHFFQEFVTDVRGEGYVGYPTFYDGWIATEIMDIARAGQGWVEVPERPSPRAAVVRERVTGATS